VPEPLLGVRNASVVYGKGAARCRALNDVSMDFSVGTLNVVMGPSGSGKTTLLSLFGCLLKPDSGRVYVEGREVSSLGETERTRLRRGRIGFVFQAFRLFESLSAEDNITVAAQIAGVRPKSARRALARKLLAELGLEDKASLLPDELSGGEKQRVAIARALVKRPAILLADEPSASLDSEAGAQVAGIFRKLAEKEKITVVVVSHDPRWEDAAHRTVVLRDGAVFQERLAAHGQG
jgi:putative ABC transport system ATP-binding protein